MDARTFRRHRRIENLHTKHCFKCGQSRREGCTFHGCNEVQHCACDMIVGGK